MGVVHFRFYGELNALLPPGLRQQAVPYRFAPRQSIKDAIEAMCVPHTEIDLLLVNGASRSFAAHLGDGDRVAVYPRFHRLPVGAVSRVRPPPVHPPRFLVDVHLGRLARYLRLLGFDTAYDPEADDDALAHRSRSERRILLTRDRGLLKRGEVRHGQLLHATDPRAQLAEVVWRFELADRAVPFSRCMRCNAPLEDVARDEVLERLPPRTSLEHDRFRRCPACARIFWPGSHHRRMQALIDEVVSGTTGR